MQPLRAGDTVDIIAPSYKPTAEMLEQARNFLDSWRLKARIAENITGDDLFCANDDEGRFRVVSQAFENSESKAIWAIRGGYGCTRIIERIRALPKPKMQKLLIGFSDISVLHTHVNQEWKWPSLHAPVLSLIIQKKIEADAIAKLKTLLFGEEKSTYFSLTAMNDAARKNDTIISTLTGGNLSLVQVSIGTDWQLKPANKILLLEDTDERPYRIDRKLIQLLQTGMFEQVKAVIFGTFDGEEESINDQVLARFVANLSIPVLRTKQIGHVPQNHPAPLNTKATLTLGVSPKLELENVYA